MPTKDALLSIVTPSYNQGDFIEEALCSVMEQDFDRVEHIVIDGGSEDNTVPLLEKYESRYNLRWVSEQDEGQSEAINKGIEMAEGRFIGWINADDYYLPGAFQTFKKGLDHRPDANIIYGDFVFVDSNGKEMKPKYHTRPSRFIHKHWQNYTANHCTFIEQSVFDEVGDIREDLEYVMDAELFWRILNGNFTQIHLPKFMAARRLHEDAKTVGETTERNKREKQNLEAMYTHTTIETLLPDSVLMYLAVGLQMTLFMRERRWIAFRDLFDRALAKL